MNNYSTVKLTKEMQSELISDFDCGNPALTAFIKSESAVDDMLGTTYVMFSSSNRLIGYYNITTGDIISLKNIRIGGSVYINYLAVDKQYQKQKYHNHDFYASDWLLADCLRRIRDIRDNHIGFAFITLSSTAEGERLYERNGFFPIEEDMMIAKNKGEKTCSPMYFPIDFE